jgi:hypothetical protein
MLIHTQVWVFGFDARKAPYRPLPAVYLPILERNVIFRRLLHWLLLSWSLLLPWLRIPLPAQHLHFFGNDFSGIALDSVFFILIGL